MPSVSGVGRSLDHHRQALLIGLTVVELLVLLIVLLRWFDRRYGLRGTVRRVGRGFAVLLRDLAAPIARALRFRRGVQVIAARYAEGDPVAAARGGLASVRNALAERDDCWPYVIHLGPSQLTVGIAGPGRLPAPDPEATPWRVAGDRRWTSPRRPETVEVTAILGAGSRLEPERPALGGRTVIGAGGGVDKFEASPETLPVAVGVSGEELVLLDVARSPGIVSVHGAPGPVDRLVEAMTTQLATLRARGDIAQLVVATDGQAALAEALAVLDGRRRGGRVVLVCDRPGPDAAARIAALIARDAKLLVLVAGYLPGSRWRLRVTTANRVVAPELGLHADAAPLRSGMEHAGARPVTPSIAPSPSSGSQPSRSQPSAFTTAGVGPAELADCKPDWADEDGPVPSRPALIASDDLIEPAEDENRPVARSGAANEDGNTPHPGDN